MKELSDLSEDDLRNLFIIVQRDHPDALASSLASLLNDDTNEIDSSQAVETTPEMVETTSEMVETTSEMVETTSEMVETTIEKVEEDVPIGEPEVVGSEIDNDNVTPVADAAPSPTVTSQETAPTPVESPLPTPPVTPPPTPPPTSPSTHSSTPPPPPSPKPMPQAPPIGAGEGCYVYYEASSAKLKLQYSKSNVPEAIGFYSASTIPAFKFKKNFGRADLIGNCASGVQGRKNYYSGICQFIRLARSALKAELETFGEIKGELYLYPVQEGRKVLPFDCYAYDQMNAIQSVMLPPNTPIQDIVCSADALACLPKHCDIFSDVRQIDFNRWLTEANNIGATSRMTDESSKVKHTPSPKKASNLYSTKKFIPVVTKSASSSKLVDDAAAETTDEQDAHVYTNPVEVSEEKEKDEEMELPGDQHQVEGCYLLYDSDSGKLMLRYSKKAVNNAIGFYCAGTGHSIQAFKFKRNFGRAELIGNCQSGVTGRKNFMSGWCQFIRAARAVKGDLWIYPRKKKGLDVDIYVYYQSPQELNMGEYQTVKLMENEKLNITDIDAVACVPKFTDFFEELKLVEINRWLTEGNTIGATSRFI